MKEGSAFRAHDVSNEDSLAAPGFVRIQEEYGRHFTNPQATRARRVFVQLPVRLLWNDPSMPNFDIWDVDNLTFQGPSRASERVRSTVILYRDRYLVLEPLDQRREVFLGEVDRK